MRFDPNKWKEMKANEAFKPAKGLLHVMCSQAAAVYVTSKDGIQALAGVGTSVKAQGDYAEVTVETDGRVFVYDPANVVHTSTGDILSTADRMPLENGTMKAIKQATREAQLAQREMLREMKAERAKWQAERDAAQAVQPPVDPEPEPGPDPEPDEKDEEKS